MKEILKKTIRKTSKVIIYLTVIFALFLAFDNCQAQALAATVRQLPTPAVACLKILLITGALSSGTMNHPKVPGAQGLIILSSALIVIPDYKISESET